MKFTGVNGVDILFSVVLIIGSIYLYILVGLESPAPTATELGAAFWPRIILFLLCLLSIVNLIQAIRKVKAGEMKATEGLDIAGFLKSRLFVGIVFVLIMAFLLPEIGFIPTCFLFLFFYGWLLGAKNKGFLLLTSVIITVILYLLFQGALDIMLPRGVGPFRTFALTIETMLPF